MGILQTLFDVSSIHITGMYDMSNSNHSFAAHRLKDFAAVVSNRAPHTVTSGKSLAGSDFKLCKKYPGIPPAGEEVIMDCDKEMSGRYVYIYIPHFDYLFFCEVKVYGEGEGEGKGKGTWNSSLVEIRTSSI